LVLPLKIDSQESRSPIQDNQTSSRVIEIEICKNCRTHRSNTWHDEEKYKKTFIEGTDLENF